MEIVLTTTSGEIVTKSITSMRAFPALVIWYEHVPGGQNIPRYFVRAGDQLHGEYQEVAPAFTNPDVA